MTGCKFTWKSENYVLVEGDIDGSCQFKLIFEREQPALWIDFGGVRRVNSQGVHAWVTAVEKKSTKLHFVNLPVCVMEQFSLLPEFRGKQSDVSSFWVQYACHSCRRDENVLLVVGRDIQPGLPQYEDGPEQHCSECGRVMEFSHDPGLFLAFMKRMPMPPEIPEIKK